MIFTLGLVYCALYSKGEDLMNFTNDLLSYPPDMPIEAWVAKEAERLKDNDAKKASPEDDKTTKESGAKEVSETAGEKKNKKAKADQSEKNKLTLDDLTKGVARECFNATMPVLILPSEDALKKAIQFAIVCKYAKAKEYKTLRELFAQAKTCFEDKLLDKLVRASRSMGTHVPKMMSTNISDSAISFAALKPLSSGITSSNIHSNRNYTGSKDGTLVAAFGFLSATYKVGEGKAMSLFERIANEDKTLIKLLHELSGDKTFVSELIDAAKVQLTAEPSSSISQFHKQNFVEFAGERITLTPLQSVNTTVGLKRAIDEIFRSKARVSIKRYVAGGAQSQNVSALNQDLGGAIPHIQAWIPNMRRKRNAFYYVFRHRNLFLNREQKSHVSTLGWWMGKMEESQKNNLQSRTRLDNLFNKLAQEWLLEFTLFAQEIDRIKDESVLENIRSRINPLIARYLKANTKQLKSEVAEDLAIELVGLCRKQLQRNKLNHHIDDQSMDVMCRVFEKGEVTCHSL